MDNRPELSILKMERASSPLLQANLSLPVHQPKGRGRPRASYAQTGEFDLGLIREFRSRPALYDRSNKRFKDKIHVAQLWMQISHKLGYDVSILRERMITLRNRYNIEKRRVENNSLSISGSQWPLFENLSFLSEHIRSRRSYKTQCKSLDEEDDEEPFDVDDGNSESNGPAKGIKHELEPDYEDGEDFDCDGGPLPVTTMLSIPHSTPTNVNNAISASSNNINNSSSNNISNNNSNNNMLNGKAALPMANCRQPELLLRVAKPKRAPQAQEEEPPAAKRRPEGHSAAAPATSASATTTNTTITAITTYPKFRAFGEFVSHSLNELPHAMSMRLVEKFTRELVQATIANEHSQTQKRESMEPSSMDEMDD
ncbi:putative uncharacterized protein DDB_G0287457 isoform X2 [Drosophila novamexicana]|uniref:putative uncharacterized protein DDB_G0287457 isoform X2 n=1 Tax=Drosophila novamexicana TaxID=47314 RepID=UPI0011E605B5|nr:putative uncharacterized protein DDB_G0287457 isoform X2 [Drosophila novamexicana]